MWMKSAIGKVYSLQRGNLLKEFLTAIIIKAGSSAGFIKNSAKTLIPTAFE
jgi:hypothetical protein